MPNHKFGDVDLDDEIVTVNGKRFTENDANALADELSGRERSNANLQPGRKSLSGGRTHSPVIQGRVSEATRDKFEKIAKNRGVRASKLLRELLDDFVAREDAS